jgi:predicted transcriptional regulator
MELQKVAAIIATLGETNGSPESMLYIFCDMDMDKWTAMRYALVQSDLIIIKGNYVTLTAKGKALADKLNKTIGH